MPWPLVSRTPHVGRSSSIIRWPFIQASRFVGSLVLAADGVPPRAERPSANSPAHPCETQTPSSSYPHVFPSRHSPSPVERNRATPPDASAGHCFLAGPSEEHVSV